MKKEAIHLKESKEGCEKVWKKGGNDIIIYI